MTTQDIRSQLVLPITSGSGDLYYGVPYRSVLRDIKATTQAVATGATSFDVKAEKVVADGSDIELGKVEFDNGSSNVAAGTVASFTPDGSNGSTVLAAGDVIKISAASVASAGLNVVLDVEMDPFARRL